MSETLNDEAILINLENGNYYTLNKTGTIIWQSIEKNYSRQQIIIDLNNRFVNDSNLIEDEALKFINTLISEQIIIEENSTNTLNIEDLNSAEKKELFIIPSIEKYDDMQAMLLADPIHDVEEEGWPLVK
ncbi:MAG: PqqD family protein [Candidatus Sericytochromatia bacterium]